MIVPIILDAIPFWDYIYIEYEDILEMEKDMEKELFGNNQGQDLGTGR